MNRFEIGERLGTGGFGTVYRAWDRRLERDVAVKVIETSAQSGPRIRREAQAAARLNHPGIVTLFEFTHHEFGPEGGRAYLVSELIEGDTVRRLIDREQLSDREIAEIGADVCEALDHAHSRGVVHRDIKPDNLISPYREGGAKLMDFGVARLSDGEDLTSAGDVVGTLSYMAPEQAEGLPVGPSGDVFALALTLFEAWTGHNPRRRETPAATVRQLDREMPFLADARPDLPQALAEVVDACLELDPELRPELADLGNALEDTIPLLDDSVARPEPARTGLFDDRRISPGGIGVAGAAAGAVATGMIVSGQADFGSVALLAILSGTVTLVQARIGFILSAVGLSAWLGVVAAMPGAALVVALVGALPAVLVQGGGRPLGLVPAAPLIGTVGLAPVLPALAALATHPRDRVVVALAGLTAASLAEAASGTSLLFGRYAKAPPGWEASVSAALGDLVLPVLTSPTWLVAAVVWAGIALLAGAIAERVRRRRHRSRPGPIALAAVGSDRVTNAN
jgi:eukaryotic-like serine/threonine-protein kinase